MNSERLRSDRVPNMGHSFRREKPRSPDRGLPVHLTPSPGVVSRTSRGGACVGGHAALPEFRQFLDGPWERQSPDWRHERCRPEDWRHEGCQSGDMAIHLTQPTTIGGGRCERSTSSHSPRPGNVHVTWSLLGIWGLLGHLLDLLDGSRVAWGLSSAQIVRPGAGEGSYVVSG